MGGAAIGATVKFGAKLRERLQYGRVLYIILPKGKRRGISKLAEKAAGDFARTSRNG